MRSRSVTSCSAVLALGLASVSLAQPDPSGIEFVTVGSPGNPAYNGPDPDGTVAGRGSVGYAYRIGKTEVTSAQWLEFMNAAKARPDPIPFISEPGPWGGVRDTSYPGPGVRYRLSAGIPNADMVPVGGISWRTAAIFTNWLNNDKSLEFSAFMNGAYDVSTFGTIDGNPYHWGDQLAHNPGARYWIPTLDEWMKAAHWSPTNPNNGGWFTYPLGSDSPPVYGPPPGYPGGSPDNQANSGFTLPGGDHFYIPLMSYPNALSPWGAMDMAGSKEEWTESVWIVDDLMARFLDGSWAGTVVGTDSVYGVSGSAPSSSSSGHGFRIAAVSIPSPAAVSVLLTALISPRRRRSER